MTALRDSGGFYNKFVAVWVPCYQDSTRV